MPVAFILLGLILLYLAFYPVCIPHKKTLILLILCVMLGFFMPYINILNGLLINLFTLIPLFIFCLYCIVQLNKKTSVFYLGFVGITSFIYIIFVLFDMDFCTLLHPLYSILIVGGISLIFSFKVYLSMSYFISCFILFDLYNLFLVKSTLGTITLLSLELYQGIIVGLVCIAVCHYVWDIIQIKVRDKEKDHHV